jgi:ABC-type sugar transport system permease subunit
VSQVVDLPASTPDVPTRKPRFWQGRTGSQKVFILTALTPMVLYVAFWSLLPILWAAALGFFDYSARRQGGVLLGLGGDNPFVGLQHYRAMLNFSPEAPLEVRLFHISVRTTLLFAFLVVPLNLLITLPLAAMIESVHVRWRVAFRTLFFLPIVTSSVGVAIMWGYILHPQRGLLNAAIGSVTGRMTAINWTGDANLMVGPIPVALLAVIIAYLWQDIGYNLIIFIAALQGIPDSIRDAAIMDGATGFSMFRHITLPLLKPTILLAAILTMISAFQVFDIFQVMTRGGPDDQTRVMTFDIYDNAFRFQNMGWAAACAAVLFIIVLIVSLIQNRMLRSEWEY